MNLKNKRVLITGANGFIGARIAARLTQAENARVRAMVRTRNVGTRHSPNRNFFASPVGSSEPSFSDARILANASPVPRDEIVIGDIIDARAIADAIQDCDIVIHCAAMQGARGQLRDFRRVNVEGTLNLLRAAKRAGVVRFIHLSTINVHGYPPPRDCHSDSPLAFTGDFYSISKAEGERAAWKFARAENFPLVVIRPACTYGPRSTAWTLVPLQRVQRGAPVLIGTGDGICNAIYIDNLVDLIIFALTNDAAIGHAFIGAEGRGVTWREFYGAYARMLGITRLNSLPRWFFLLAASGFENLARITRTPPRLTRASVEFFSHRVVYDISQAQKILGYTPRVSFAEGMRLTEEWLKAEGRVKMTNDK
ncbi:MAG: NAD-dependent epimerase/dehydratase family protein [Chloroflexi bacterium]|nr:NAD-dependent epimerase/dehydratase family protein [Chloroflexota bacterium]